MLLAVSEFCSEDGECFVKCLCDCGKEHIVHVYNFRHTKSCGCLRRSLAKSLNLKHGKSESKEHMAWSSMKKRCLDSNHPAYHNYGGRGITVCKEWLESFNNFLADMGKAPSPGHSLERVNVNSGYCKENCTWATRKEQARNRRNNVLINVDGVVMTLTDWCAFYGISVQTVRHRVRKIGMSWEDALKLPMMRVRDHG